MPISQKRIKAFVANATGSPIQAYDDFGAARKALFAKEAKAIARELAKLMGLPKGSYEIRYNPGGIAVCGDVHLHGEGIYVDFSQTCLGPDWGFMYRSCKGQKDYTGGQNRWMPWKQLLDLPEAARIIAQEMAVPA